MIRRVELSKLAQKQLSRAPQRIAAKLLAWSNDVSERGVDEVRKVPGWHDHPLKGQLQGKRAISLSRQWRAVYVVRTDAAGRERVEFIEVEEVHPHDY